MAENEGLYEDQIAGGGYSQLLFADEDVGLLDAGGFFGYNTNFSAEKSPRMLCFGDYSNGLLKTSGVTCSDSSSASSINYSDTPSILFKPNKKRNGSGNEIQSLTNVTGAPAGNQRNSKKSKSENSTVTGRAKVKKENLGERISALQQIVSPYGKTDTASVLHEAMGYIRFLQEQVHVLCSPYMQLLHSSDGGENGEGESRKDLRSRGLCLVPLECTLHVANDNGADFWSPAMVDPTSKH